ncbi:uncharacterized protein DUF202 [Stackebrandtia endophytica]|uniref:Uncharacterized protein DUF202 n=1 Tax=Stackebrandtia endophytica TaxID=1496996 RepID=A0A543AY18_9ACTN|nr:DUF202 domain-containing protein [Stackebrandtia endophytica]TQL77469.1 uncharacterized protein DUF202 [Stackebrandtia endophytica]
MNRPPRDPGAQPERTRLAWRRTLLAATVLGLLAARGVIVEDTGPRQVTLIALLALTWLALLIVSHRRIRALATDRPVTLPWLAALGAVGVVLTLAVLAVLTMVV